MPINDTLLKVFEEWLKRREGRLFTDYTPNQVSMAFRRRRREAGLPKGISIHTLRATFACHLIAKGVNIYTVSKLLGHSSVKVTERHYLALDPAHLRDAVNHLNFDIPSDTDG